MLKRMTKNMNEEQKKTYFAWLADAHAMEQGLAKTLEKQIEAAKKEKMPEMHDRLMEHLEETREHAAKVESCLKRLGGDPSTGKDLMSQMGAVMQSWMASVPSDAHIKNMHASYAAEHFEIGAYTIIMATAEHFGDAETAQACREILEDEKDMASWLNAHLPDHTVEHVKGLKP